MDSIPDAWPVEPPREAPMFPLPGVFLFPMQLMPLHVFEPRYRQMIEDSLDGPGRIVMATVPDPPDPPDSKSEEVAREPHVHPVAGLGEIARHQKLPDGRYLIWLAGLARVRIDELDSDRPYRRVRYEVMSEIAAGPDQARALREPLEQAILSRREDQLNLPDDMPTGLLADILLQHLPLSVTEMAQAFSEVDATRRANLALEAHGRYPS